MDDMDLDYNVEEIKGEEKQGKVPNWLLMIFRGVGVILFILIGLLFLFLIRNFTAWVSNPYKALPSSDEPREPLTTYEIVRSFDIMVTNKDIEKEELNYDKKKPIIEKVKVMVDKVILAYEPNNTDLATVINSKAPNIERIVRETISKQSVNDLMSNRTIEIVVKRNIIKELNNYMVGVEEPKIENGRPVFLDKILKENNRVFIVDVDKTYKYVKVVINNVEGWVSINDIEGIKEEKLKDIVGTEKTILKETKLIASNRIGGVEGVRRGFIEIYFPKGFRVLPFYKEN